MTDQTIITIVGLIASAIPSWIAAVKAQAALKQGQANGVKADVANKKADVANSKVDKLTTKTQDIHDLTDGQLTQVTQSLAAANDKITDLHTVISNLKGTNH